jgi:hypothetical protein
MCVWGITGHGAKNDRMLTRPAQVIGNCDNVDLRVVPSPKWTLPAFGFIIIITIITVAVVSLPQRVQSRRGNARGEL